jgi:hypothetical protein
MVLPLEAQEACIERAESFAKTGKALKLVQDPVCIPGLRFKIVEP